MDANRSAIIADSVDSNGRSCGIAAMEIVNIPLGNAQASILYNIRILHMHVKIPLIICMYVCMYTDA